MYEVARGDALFYALMEIAVRIFGAACAAFVGALILRLAARVVAVFWPGFWKSYRAIFLAGSVIAILQYGIAKASTDPSMAIWQTIVTLLIALYVQFLFYRRLIERTVKAAIGWIKPSAVSLILTVLGILVYLGITALDRKLAAGGESLFLRVIKTVFTINKAAWMNQTYLFLAAAIVLVLTHLLLLVRRQAEPSWLACSVLAAALIPYGFGFMLVASQLFLGISQPGPAGGSDSLPGMISMFAAARQVSLWIGCAVILILFSGRLVIRLRRHRLLTAMRMGPIVPAFFWVVDLPLLAISGSLFLHFLLEQSFMGVMTGSTVAASVATVTAIRLLTGMHFLGLFTIATGVALMAVAHWRAGHGLGKAPWPLLATIIFLLLLSGGNIFFSLYRYGIFLSK